MQNSNIQKLTEFVDLTKSKGATDEFLTKLLAHQGWPEDEIFAALGAYWERITGLPVPERALRGESSRDAFLYLLSFATLATWASALGSMLFRFIEYWYPDPVVAPYWGSLRSTVTWQMASIAVAFPIFLFVMRTILSEAQNQPERLQSGVRKWLTYIALLLTAGGLISDLICFFDFFLKGELTTRFLLKAFTVLVICAAIFFYYLRSLRWDKEIDLGPARSQSLKFGIASALVVIVTFCVGLGVAGTPSMQRHLEADNRRAENLRTIAYSLHAWFLRTKTVPEQLTDLVGNGVTSSQILDPESKMVYEYRPKPDNQYELCATFSGPSEGDKMQRTQFWYHGKGQTCFTLDASTQPVW